MAIETNLLKWSIGFFEKIKFNAERIIHDLKFMKLEMEFGERDDDIYVATFLKSGTTWMQMILYQLTTDGNVDFNHIYDVSPWLRNLVDSNGAVPQVPSPRIIKTHDPYHKIQKGKKGRFIFVIRDGRDVALSLYHHRKNYNNSKLSFNESFEMTFKEEGVMNWFSHTQQWLKNKNNHNILYVRYEDLHTDFANELQRIAKFLNITIKAEDLPRIIERTSFAFMKAHEEKFGEQPPAEKHEIVYNQFIRSGKTGQGKEQLSAEDLAIYNFKFNVHLGQYPIMQAYKAEKQS